MTLNSAIVIELLIKVYSGIFLYFSNSTTQDSYDKGGNTPKTGSHSVMERPESVILVAPPIKTRRIKRNSNIEDQIIKGRFVFFLVSFNLNLVI